MSIHPNISIIMSKFTNEYNVQCHSSLFVSVLYYKDIQLSGANS